MKLFEILLHLNEGGAAIKGAAKITQAEVREYVPDLLKKIQSVLDLPSGKVKLIGSAGKKPKDSDLSGDLDLAVECDMDLLDEYHDQLADGQLFRMMRGINVFSIAYKVGDKLVQVDLIPVANIKFAEWSYQANKEDILQGLKGAQRNELFFAVAKYMPQEVLKKDKDGEPIDIKRYFYDLSKGVMTGTKTRTTKTGKLSKNFATTDKKVLTNDPQKITTLLFGKGVKPEQVSTFEGTLKAIKSPNFPHKEKLEDIIELTIKGIKNKGLKVPTSLD